MGASAARTFGLPLELISAAEAQELFPLMSTEGVLGAAWLPTDGYIDPSQLTFALADGARQGGCRTFTSTRVTGIDIRDGRVRGVRTDRGEIEAEVVVDAGGMYAAEIARMAGEGWWCFYRPWEAFWSVRSSTTLPGRPRATGCRK